MNLNNKNRRGGCLFSLIKLFLLVVVVLAAAVYFLSGFLATVAVNNFTQVFGIKAGVSSISVDFKEQQIDVKKFYVANPAGYPEGNAVYFNEAFIDLGLSVGKLIDAKTIVIDEIKIDGLQLSVEFIAGAKGGFLGTPKSNLNELASKFESGAGSTQTPTKQNSGASDKSEPVKFIVKKIIFSDGTIRTSLNGKGINVPLPSFQLENLGVAQNGLTGGQLAAQITGALATKGTADALKAILRESVNLGDEAGGEARKAGSSVVDSIKSLF